jgi:hypothetical protein
VDYQSGIIISGQTTNTTPGYTSWNSSRSCLEVQNEFPGSILQVGQELYVLAHNASGGPLVEGNIVYLDSFYGSHRFNVMKALADSLDTAKVLGVVTTPMTNGADGLVTIFGGVHGVNTFGETSGVPVYLSDTVAGGWTTTKPAVAIRIGFIGNIDVTDGSFLVLIDEKPPSIFASVYSNKDQPYNGTDSEVVTFEQEFGVVGLGHSTTVNPEEIEFYSSGSYVITANFEVYRITGANAEEYRAWLQKSTDGGTVWTDIPYTNTKVAVFNGGETARLSANVGAHFDKGDKLRVRARASSNQIKLQHIAAAGDEPAQASVMFSLYRLGD